MQNFEVWFLLQDNEPISRSYFSSFLHILPLKQYTGWISMKSMKTQIILQKMLVDKLFYQIFNFIASSVIYLSLSEISIFWVKGVGNSHSSDLWKIWKYSLPDNIFIQRIILFSMSAMLRLRVFCASVRSCLVITAAGTKKSVTS